MDSASVGEMNRKVHGIIEKLLLPYDKFIEHYQEYFNEQMQNPGIAARIHVEIDTKVNEITEAIHLAREKLEKSSFYENFMKQMQNPEMVARLKRVIGTDPHHSKFQVVLYGVGGLKPVKHYQYVEHCHMQLAFAILLRERFNQWINDVVVYDPVLSLLERRAIDNLNCTCLCVNERGRRTVDRPTLFFMPHCTIYLYENVLDANWMPSNLNKIIILGNSFSNYSQVCLDSCQAKRVKAIRKSDRILHEIPLPETTIGIACHAPNSRSSSLDPVFARAFKHLSWHFFAWDCSLDDLNLDLSSKD